MDTLRDKNFWKINGKRVKQLGKNGKYRFLEREKGFLTRHTGFKGSWLTIWLLEMGAEVIGYSNDIPTIPAFLLKLT